MPDIAGLDSLAETEKSLVDAAGGNANASWQQLRASLTDSKFNTNFQSKYAALGNTDLIKALNQEVFGSAPSDYALGYFQNLITYYQAYYSKFGDRTDPTGLIRAKGTLIGDMLKEAMDANIGKYPVAEASFLTAAHTRTATYGIDLFATKAGMVGVADPAPGDELLI
jgi:hypothetical protein